MSEALGGIGSEAISAVPVRVKTRATSGWAERTFSTSNCMAWLSSSEIEGTRLAWTSRSPSSSVGANSRPRAKKATTPRASASAAPPATALGRATAARRTGSKRVRTAFMALVSPCPFGSRTARAVRAGTKVRDSTKAPARANITVAAIGVNILPSTPSKVSSGA